MTAGTRLRMGGWRSGYTRALADKSTRPAPVAMIATVNTPPAGFWIRAAAAVIDFALSYVVKLSLAVVVARMWRLDVSAATGLQGTLTACMVVFALLYTIVLHALEGQTIGKLVVRIRVVGSDGAPPPIGASVLRSFAYAVSLMPFGLGFVIAGLRADGRALHDLLAGTRVERVSRAVLAPPPPMDKEISWTSN